MPLKIIAAAVLVSLAFFGAAQAVTIQAVSANNATIAPFALANFGNGGTNALISSSPVWLSNGVITFGQAPGSPVAGVYDGVVAGVAASPYGTTQLAPRNYLAAEPGNSVIISYSTPQTQFQLLWGSIDSYNSLLFTRADGSSTTVSGGDILRADGGATSAFVTLSGLGSFTSVTAISTNPAFEFVPGAQIPEPASIAIIVAGIGAFFWVRRRRMTKT